MNNLNNLSDKELDKVFKDAFENGDSDLIHDQWDSMRKLLDDEAQKPSFWIKYRGLSVLLFLLLALFLAYTFLPHAENLANKASPMPEKTTAKSIEHANFQTQDQANLHLEKKVNTTFDNLKTENIQKSISKENIKVATNKIVSPNILIEKIQNKTSNKTSTQSNLIDQKAPASDYAQEIIENTLSKSVNQTSYEAKLASSKVTADEQGDFSKIEKNQTTENTVSKDQNTTNQIALSQATTQTVDNKNESTNPNSENKVNPEDARILFSDDFLNSFLGPFPINKTTRNDSILNPHIEIPEKKTETSTVIKKGFYLTLGYAPEYSFVSEIDRETPLGHNQAIFLNYRFSKKIAVSAGYMQSTKYYSAYPADYKWVWKSVNTPLTEIGAICRMIDIPVNVRYEIATRIKYSLFGSAGITSYMMKKETYNYFYENNADPSIKWRQWNGKTGFYAASALNLSSGIEFKLSRRLNFQIEPFAKIPLKKIGFGKVKLSTIGVLFGLNYPLNFSGKK